MKRLVDWDKVFINYLCSGWCGGLKNNPTHLPEPDLTPMYLPSSQQLESAFFHLASLQNKTVVMSQCVQLRFGDRGGVERKRRGTKGKKRHRPQDEKWTRKPHAKERVYKRWVQRNLSPTFVLLYLSAIPIVCFSLCFVTPILVSPSLCSSLYSLRFLSTADSLIAPLTWGLLIHQFLPFLWRHNSLVMQGG